MVETPQETGLPIKYITNMAIMQLVPIAATGWQWAGKEGANVCYTC